MAKDRSIKERFGNGIQGMSFLDNQGRYNGQCINCAWYNSDQKCDAYPDRIPQAVFDDAMLHDKPLPGDNGLQWAEPVTLLPMNAGPD